MTKSKSPKLYIGDIPNLSILSKWPNGYEAATTLAMKIAKMGIKPHNSTNAYNFETQYELFYVYPWAIYQMMCDIYIFLNIKYYSLIRWLNNKCFSLQIVSCKDD